ncbi:hypothetical protein C8C77_10141 [Halanaerobium saccharolyticum]|uniref:Uncharacterized protein n=1 Tax=Halanaerobium saccharolyticum TaxID=43595 RepID=A0A4R7Z7H7_9FIRM|nr:hypothetical protein [Halanaerobium saccharolyticum]RAK11731.1 hypothetical protein C7958_10241 [Halanaerobium saccharolyticum]TDW07572.1 hypothetical protein C8C77_10141 [Halanaerobium saccharolyticum]TDX64493.1 hypothetical protein C7956_10141 [Halanaerobium saccharolyticum]
MMKSQLKKAVVNHQQEEFEKYLKELETDNSFFLASLIEDLLPLMLMECSLRYGSFHFVKMSLFLRELSQKKYFSREAELEIARVVLLGLSERHFINLEADSNGYKEKEVNQRTYSKLGEEINNGNSHNAFYYALGILEHQPEQLKEYLINLGMERIPDSLGHSVSCFFPVMRDLVNHHKDVSATGVLSYIMYLCRYSYQGKYNSDQQKRQKPSQEELEELGLKATSGSGIVNLHHMITNYTFFMLEDSSFYQQLPPYSILENYFGSKKIEQKRLELAENNQEKTQIAENYQQFKDNFSLKSYQKELDFLFYNLAENYKETVSHLHQLFAEYYNPHWNPHYYTGLYCALGLYKSEKIKNDKVKKMAVIQAVEYFANNVL